MDCRQRLRYNQYQLSIKMLDSPNQQLKDSKQQPLLPQKRQKQACLKAYIQLYQDYQLYIALALRLFLSYFLAHIIAALCFEAWRSGKNMAISQMMLPEIIWGACVLCFGGSFQRIDPHIFGVKRINLYKIKIRTTHLYFIALIVLILLILPRNYLLYSSYLLALLDSCLLLLSLRIILMIFNFQNQAGQAMRIMKQQQFYFVPVVKRRQMQEPFHMDEEGDLNETAKMRKQRCIKAFEKYYKPLKRKDFNQYNEEEFQGQLYSH